MTKIKCVARVRADQIVGVKTAKMQHANTAVVLTTLRNLPMITPGRVFVMQMIGLKAALEPVTLMFLKSNVERLILGNSMICQVHTSAHRQIT